MQDNWQKIFSQSGVTSGEEYGSSVAISRDGNTIAVGAEGGKNNNNGAISGSVQVIRANDPNGYFFDGDQGDRVGQSVALSADGTTLAFGAFTSDLNGVDSGHVEVCRFNGQTWSKVGDTLLGDAPFDRFGVSVALSNTGQTVAIGAYGSDINGQNGGLVLIYQFIGNRWQQLGQDIVGESAFDLSGESVSLSGNGLTLAVGAPGNDANGKTNSGHARAYRYNPSTNLWLLLCCDSIGGNEGDQYGNSVSLSEDGEIIAIGATQSGTVTENSKGYVLVFRYIQNENRWVQLGSILNGLAVGDRFGASISLSSNGFTLAVGAPHPDGGSGSTTIFRYNGNIWEVIGLLTDGIGEFGGSVALSAAGNILAIGARLDNNNVGEAHVFFNQNNNNII